MGVESFFDYPTRSNNEDKPEDFVLLPNWAESKWAKLLRYASTVRFRPGDDVMRMGDLDRSFYIITEGSVEVLVPRKHGTRLQRINVMDVGAVIGEMAFFDARPRSATVRGLTEGEMLRVGHQAFEELSAREPDLARDVVFDLARLLSTKLRGSTRFISKMVG